MLNVLQVRPMDECNASGHCWVERRYRSRGGVRRVRTCERCHRTTVSLPSGRAAHRPAHALSAARWVSAGRNGQTWRLAARRVAIGE